LELLHAVCFQLWCVVQPRGALAREWCVTL
jgi:hypothetical protein